MFLLDFRENKMTTFKKMLFTSKKDQPSFLISNQAISNKKKEITDL